MVKACICLVKVADEGVTGEETERAGLESKLFLSCSPRFEPLFVLLLLLLLLLALLLLWLITLLLVPFRLCKLEADVVDEFAYITVEPGKAWFSLFGLNDEAVVSCIVLDEFFGRRFLVCIPSFFIVNGLFTPCNLKYKPHALQTGSP